MTKILCRKVRLMFTKYIKRDKFYETYEFDSDVYGSEYITKIKLIIDELIELFDKYGSNKGSSKALMIYLNDWDK